jgi:hypothetical protein
MDIIKRLSAKLRDIVRPRFRVEYVQEDIPDILKRKTLYVVKEDVTPWSAAMVCPCGCRSILHLNLLPDERPMWIVTHHTDMTVSLSPSVWRKVDCQSHFWFRHSRIYWTPDQKHTLIRDLRLFVALN